MKLLIHRHGEPPLEIESCDRIRIDCGRDGYELRDSPDPLAADSDKSLLVRLETHDGSLAVDLAVFPSGANSVRLKGGLR